MTCFVKFTSLYNLQSYLQEMLLVLLVMKVYFAAHFPRWQVYHLFFLQTYACGADKIYSWNKIGNLRLKILHPTLDGGCSFYPKLPLTLVWSPTHYGLRPQSELILEPQTLFFFSIKMLFKWPRNIKIWPWELIRMLPSPSKIHPFS